MAWNTDFNRRDQFWHQLQQMAETTPKMLSFHLLARNWRCCRSVPLDGHVECGQYGALCNPVFDFRGHFSSVAFCELQRLQKCAARNFDDFVAAVNRRCDHVDLGSGTGMGETIPLSGSGEQGGFLERTETIREDEAETLVGRLLEMQISFVQVCVHCCENETLDEVAVMLAPFLPIIGFSWDAVRHGPKDGTDSYMDVRY